MASGSGQGGSNDERGSRTVAAGSSTKQELPGQIWIHLPSTHLEVLVDCNTNFIVSQRLLNPGEEPPRGVSAARWIPLGELNKKLLWPIEVHFVDFEIVEYRLGIPLPHWSTFELEDGSQQVLRLWETEWHYHQFMPQSQRSRDDSGSEQPTTSPHN